MFSIYFYCGVLLVIWQALVYEDGNLVAGSLEACIQHLVPTADYYPDVSIDDTCTM